MDYNKGRFVPTINPLSIFSQKDARTPFEGELNVDEETNDIGFWRKNPTSNLWENISRTKDILEKLNVYEEDTTFSAAKAFIADGLIHRFYYNKLELLCWLDASVSNDEYKYYAIKSVKKINGKQRYITGNNSHDGSNYLNALTDISTKASLVFEVLPNDWYTVEFYDINKQYKASINYISYPSKVMPIERDLKETGAKELNSKLIRNMDTRLIDVAVKFNQNTGLNSAYIYKNQPISDLKATIIKRMADGHTCVAEKDIAAIGFTITNDSDEDKTLKTILDGITPEIESRVFKYWSLDKITEANLEVLTSTVVPANSVKKFDVYAMMESIDSIEDRIRYNGFDKIDNLNVGEYDCTVLFDYIKTDSSVSKKYKVDMCSISVVDNKDVVVNLNNVSSDDRNYISVLVQQIGTNQFTNIENYEILHNDSYDSIVIPRNYFGFGRNVVKITYTESIQNPLVKINDLTLFIPVKVTVKEDDYFDIDKFIPAGYVTNPGRGLYYINLKYFAHFTNGRIEDITDKVEIINPVNKSAFGVTQTVKVRVYVDHIHQVYHDYEFTVYCADPAISGNNSRVIINNNTNPRILFYNGNSFTLGSFGTSGNQIQVPISSILDSSVMSFNGNKPTHIRIREVEDSTKIYTDIVDSEDKLIYMNKLVVPLYESPIENVTLGELIDSLTPNTYDNYNFQYYSINGEMSGISVTDRDLICPKNKLVKFNETLLSEVHMKNTSIYSVSKDKPFLVEGYYKDETGKYVCTGGIIHYAQSQS